MEIRQTMYQLLSINLDKKAFKHNHRVSEKYSYNASKRRNSKNVVHLVKMKTCYGKELYPWIFARV